MNFHIHMEYMFHGMHRLSVLNFQSFHPNAQSHLTPHQTYIVMVLVLLFRYPSNNEEEMIYKSSIDS